MTRTALVLAGGVLLFGQAPAGPPATASISGMITTDEQQPRALRRAIVTIEEAASAIQPRVVTSDEDGRFVFRNLPAGRYSVSAARPPFVRAAYGAKRVVGPGAVQTGTMVVVGIGQPITNINVALPRGSAITGMVRDFDGQPARGFRVNAYYAARSATTGEKTMMSATTATTDDRGVYRLWGLRPGNYLVSASGSLADATPQSELEVSRATELLQRPGVASGAAMTSVPAATPTPAPRRPTVGYSPVFYPGVTDGAQAVPVTLGVGEERSGIDMSIQLVPTARLDVMVSYPDPRTKPRAQLRVTAVGAMVAAPAGVTTYSVNDETPTQVPGLSPGTYVLTAGTPGTDAPILTAAVEVQVAGADQSITLQLQPGVTVSGRIMFEATTLKPPPDLTRIRALLSAAQSSPGGVVLPGAPPGLGGPGGVTLTANGEFTIANVRPGRYRLDAALPLPSHESGWYPKSVSLAGQDAFEGWADIRPGGSVTGATITMTDRPTELSGTMTDAAGAAAPEYFMIVFSADPAHWVPSSRRIMQTRPSSDGSFVFRNLPPGDYRLAAVAEVQQGEWFDPDFLNTLVDASIKVTLAPGAKLRQDIRIR